MSPKVWLLTGCSSGFGRFLARAALKSGDKVVATARDPKKIDALKALGAATLALDVYDTEENIQKAVADANAAYGRIDILVNNSVYILEGTVEDSRYVTLKGHTVFYLLFWSVYYQKDFLNLDPPQE